MADEPKKPKYTIRSTGEICEIEKPSEAFVSRPDSGEVSSHLEKIVYVKILESSDPDRVGRKLPFPSDEISPST